MADDEEARVPAHDQLDGDDGIQREGDECVSPRGRAHWGLPFLGAGVILRGAQLATCIPCAIQALIVCLVIFADHCFLCLYVVFNMGLTCSLNSRSLVLFREGRQRETRKPATTTPSDF